MILILKFFPVVIFTKFPCTYYNLFSTRDDDAQLFQPIVSDAKHLQPHDVNDVDDDETIEEDGRRWVAMEIVTSYLIIVLLQIIILNMDGLINLKSHRSSL